MRLLSFIIGGLLAAAMGVAAYAQNTLLTSPAVTVTTTTSGTPVQQIVSPNASRKQIRICNVGTNVVWVWPGPALANGSPPASITAVSAYELPALSSGTTVCFTEPDGTVYAGGPGHGQAYYMESVTSGVGSVSVWEWF